MTESDSSLGERRALWSVGGTGCLFFLLSTPFLGVSSAGSVLAGCALALLNLWILSKTVRALLGGGAKAAWLVAAALKLCVLLVTLYLLFDAGLIDGFPFLLGLGSLPVGIVLAQLAPPQNQRSN